MVKGIGFIRNQGAQKQGTDDNTGNIIMLMQRLVRQTRPSHNRHAYTPRGQHERIV